MAKARKHAGATIRCFEYCRDDGAERIYTLMDVTYQTQLREMDDLNWERFKSHLDSSLSATRAELRGEFRSGFAELRAEFHNELGTMRHDLLKWMFIYWTGSVVAFGGLIAGMKFLAN